MRAASTYLLNRRKRKPTGQTRTARLQDATNEINTFGKYAGLMVTDLDTLKDYTAQGDRPTDAWRPRGVFDNTADVTPA